MGAPLPALIAAAPQAWADALEVHLAEGIFPEPAIFVEILPHLPSELQRRVAMAIHDEASQWELPWTTSFQHGALGRPADVARRALYDAGLPLPDPRPMR